MKLLIQVGIAISITISLMALFFLPKKKMKPFKISKIQRRLEQQKHLVKWLKRSRISLESFVAIHLIALFAFLILGIQNLFGNYGVSMYTPLWVLILPYALGRVRNREYRHKVAEDVEEALRLSFLLEKSGTESKRINVYLAQAIKGPLQPYLRDIAAGNSLNVDLKVAYQQLKEEFIEIRPVVNYCNINIQKINTGKTGSLYKQQLDQIKNLKLERFKMRRRANRIKLCIVAILLTLSLLSITVYPMLLDTYNTFVGSMSN